VATYSSKASILLLTTEHSRPHSVPTSSTTLDFHKRKMAGFLALPNELKDLMELSPQDLSRLSRTSKSIRREFLPLLFKRVSLHWEARGRAPPIYGLLEAILQSPKNAEMVQELHLHAEGYPEYIKVSEREGDASSGRKKEVLVDKPKVDNVTSEAKALLDTALHNMHTSGMLDENVPDENDELDVVVTIIIVHCPNLKVLQMSTEFLHKNMFLPKVLQSLVNVRSGNVTCGQGALEKLENVLLLPADSSYRRVPDFPFSSYLPFLYLPSLTTLSGCFSGRKRQLTLNNSPRNWLTSVPPICALRRLDLHGTLADSTILTFLLAQMPHLESLKYGYTQDADSYPLDCTQLQSALRSVAGTLRDLTILTWLSSRPDDDKFSGEYLLNHRGTGSLSFLKHLTKLEIPLAILLGWKDTAGLRLAAALPANLEELCLRDDSIQCKGMMWWEERTIEEIRHWMGLKAKGISTPHVRRFGYRMCSDLWQHWDQRDLRALMHICESEELECWYEGRDADDAGDDGLITENFVRSKGIYRRRGYGRWDPEVGERLVHV
jgi:hypothetical protein